MSSWEDWKQQMRTSIQGAYIALEVRDKFRSGRGAPDLEDMRGYTEEAAAVADLWEDSTLPKETT